MVAEDDADVCREVATGPGLEDGLEAEGLLRYHDGDLAGLAVGREPHRNVDVEVVAEGRGVLAALLPGAVHLQSVDLHRHPEDALADRLAEAVDVEAVLEQQGRDGRDGVSVVLADHRDRGELAPHGRYPGRLTDPVIGGVPGQPATLCSLDRRPRYQSL